MREIGQGETRGEEAGDLGRFEKQREETWSEVWWKHASKVSSSGISAAMYECARRVTQMAWWSSTTASSDLDSNLAIARSSDARIMAFIRWVIRRPVSTARPRMRPWRAWMSGKYLPRGQWMNESG